MVLSTARLRGSRGQCGKQPSPLYCLLWATVVDSAELRGKQGGPGLSPAGVGQWLPSPVDEYIVGSLGSCIGWNPKISPLWLQTSLVHLLLSWSKGGSDHAAASQIESLHLSCAAGSQEMEQGGLLPGSALSTDLGQRSHVKWSLGDSWAGGGD